MIHEVKFLNGNLSGKSFKLTENGLTIGNSRENDVVSGDVDFNSALAVNVNNERLDCICDSDFKLEGELGKDNATLIQVGSIELLVFDPERVTDIGMKISQLRLRRNKKKFAIVLLGAIILIGGFFVVVSNNLKSEIDQFFNDFVPVYIDTGEKVSLQPVNASWVAHWLNPFSQKIFFDNKKCSIGINVEGIVSKDNDCGNVDWSNETLTLKVPLANDFVEFYRLIDEFDGVLDFVEDNNEQIFMSLGVEAKYLEKVRVIFDDKNWINFFESIKIKLYIKELVKEELLVVIPHGDWRIEQLVINRVIRSVNINGDVLNINQKHSTFGVLTEITKDYLIFAGETKSYVYFF